jgi:hypothetical protein
MTDPEPFLGHYVLVRTYSAGLFAGTLEARYGKKVVLLNARQLWRWHTANNGLSICEVAVHGLNHAKSKICCVTPYIEIEDVQLMPCSDIARTSITTAPDYIAG